MSGFGALARAVRLAGGGRRRLAVSLLAGVVAAGAGIALLAVSGYLISRAAERPTVLALAVPIVVVRSLVIARALGRYTERLLSHDVALRILARTRRTVYDRLIPLVPGGLVRMRGGDLLGRIVGDVDAMQHLYVSGLGPPAVALVITAAAAGAAGAILPMAGLVLAVILGIGALGLPLMAGLAGRRAGRRQAPARAALGSEVLESLQLAPELAAYGLVDDRVRRVRAADHDLAKEARSDAAIGAASAGLVAALAGLAAAAMLAVGAPAVRDGRMDGVLLAALALLALASVEALAPLPEAARRLAATVTAARRIEEVTLAPAPVLDPAAPLPVPAAPALSLEGARLRHGADEAWVLDGVDLRLDPGRRIAIVGPSGSGKTTIAEVLVRFRGLDAGRATLDGRDIGLFGADDVRQRVRLCEQAAHLFTGSIRDNVLIGRPGASDDDVRSALVTVGLHDWIADLPHGIDTQVGEAGAEVSGGQRSRIALARVVISEAPVMILDEPAAHLDPSSARDLIDRIVASSPVRSILLITHSPIGLESFDEVLVLEDGRVVERGHAADLAEGSGRYVELMALGAGE